MKKLLIVIYLCLSCVQLVAQTGSYPNTWIDYNKTYFKIKTARAALHRIPYTVLAEQGLPANAAAYQLYYRGQEIPIYTSTGGDMGSTDYIEFYGQPNDGSFDTQLFKQAGWQLSPYKSLFTDTSSYYLTYDLADLSNLRYQTAINDLSGSLPPAETHFTHTHRLIENSIHYRGEQFGYMAGVPSHLSTWGNGEGFTGSSIGGAAPQKNYLLNLPGIYTGADASGNAQVRTRVVGNSNYNGAIPDHHLQISVLGTVYKDTTYEGYQNYTYLFNVPTSALNLAGNTTFTYTAVGDIAPVDYSQLAYLYVTYERNFNFGLQQIVSFELPNDGNKYLEITNFNGGTAPVLYDLSNQLRYLPQATNVGGQTVYRIYLSQADSGPAMRQLVLSNSGFAAVQTVNSIQARQFTDYSQTANQGDFLIISHPSLHTGDLDQVERYANYRRSTAGGGHTVVVADIEQLYDQFAWGIDKHPLSIQNWVNSALDNWVTKPKYMLLLGKSIQYRDARFSPAIYAKCLVPTYGEHASDVLLSARNLDAYTNQLSTGRIPAQTPAQVAAYLDKLIQHEAPSTCSKADRAWRRKAIHIAGGSNLAESESFLSDLTAYKNIYQDTLMGGNVVYTYYKATADTLSVPELTPLINDGVNIINFVGHSASPYWDVKLEPPSHYNNVGKYPIIFSSSCYVGNIHADQNNMSEDFILSDQSGAIGFLATVSFGFPPLMRKYMSELYKQFCFRNYDQPLGNAIRETVAYNRQNEPEDNGIKLTCSEFTLAGDPALRVVPWDKPEYVIEHNETGYSDVSFTPSQITANIDSFAVDVIISNVGKAVRDSFAVKLVRTYPNGDIQLVGYRQLAATILADTLRFYVPIGDRSKGSGENYLQISIDADNDIAEDCEDNNQVNVRFFVFSDLLVPVSPCNYTLYPNSTVTLKASTGQPSLASLPYIIQIDTTALFNSPIRQQHVQNSTSGVVQWTPALTLQANTTYYWRTSQIPSGTNPYNWQNSSFTYVPATEQGWGQQHYYQFLNDNYQTMLLDSTRTFAFEGVNNIVTVSGEYDYYQSIGSTLNIATTTSSQTCLSSNNPAYPTYGGLVFIVYKPSPQLAFMLSYKTIDVANNFNDRGQYGNVQCSPSGALGSAIPAFEFHTGTTEQVTAMMNFIQNVIPEGYYITVYSVTNHRLGTTDPTAPIYPYLGQIESFFNNMGVTGLNGLANDRAFVAFGRKGFPNYAGTTYIPDVPTEPYTVSINVAGLYNAGTVTSPNIGPSRQWHTLRWLGEAVEAPNNHDQTIIKVLGLDNNGNTQTLLSTTTVGDLDISAIDAAQYRYIKLQISSTDTTLNSPTQLRKWHVIHDMATELAINQVEHFVFNADTLQEGENISLAFALSNVSGTNADSVLVSYTVIDANNVATLLPIKRQAPIAAGQTIITQMTYSTEGMAGNNVLVVEVNPNDDQIEKFRFNNLLIIPFFVGSDKINPVMDVTFDGRHILDGDLVSAQPTIDIKTKDENPYLALNDTADFSLQLIYPSGASVPIYFNNPIVQFTPATAADAALQHNEAHLSLHPSFTESGKYQLIANSRDRSDNNFARRNYQISFEVDTKPAISHLLNYPNPFSTATQFVFTLSGSKVPQRLSIQIMTATGKVVREISQAELGTLYIGNNRTEYHWDGTDQYGSPLANGLYLYRVRTQLDGEALDKRATTDAVDAMFKNGVGKMYLLR